MDLVLVTSTIFIDECLALLFSPAVFFDFAFLTEVKGRSRQINISVFDQGTHSAEEESKNQCGNVASVHVGIGHDDYLVVAELAQIQFLRIFLCTNSNTHCTEDVLDFFTFEYFVVHCLFYVQDLTTKRQDSLKYTVAALFSRTACRVPFDQE